MRWNLLYAATFAGLMTAAPVARADTFQQYGIIAEFLIGSSTEAEGLITLDQTTGLYSSADLGFRDLFGNTDEFTNITGQRVVDSIDEVDIAGQQFSVELRFPVLNPGDYGDLLCSVYTPCPGGQSLLHGVLDAEAYYGENYSYGPPYTSETPEPSSFALLGSGLIGVAAIARRRLLKA